MTDQIETPRYAGFWIRALASLIDTFIFVIILSIVGMSIERPAVMFSSYDLMLNLGFVVLVLIFWELKQATPGKMVLGLKIVDAKTLGKPSTAQNVGRYFSYLLSTVVLFLGFFWVGWDTRKQGWHDKLAGTLVIHKTKE
ncbi:MAG: RDD family protein [Gammaproteobacteria bacterium]|nr:RDD family protein [Gammaproteobacteria bacterium]